jgi:hypothetical protein
MRDLPYCGNEKKSKKKRKQKTKYYRKTMIVPALSSHGLCAALLSKSCGSLSNRLDMIAEFFFGTCAFQCPHDIRGFVSEGQQKGALKVERAVLDVRNGVVDSLSV